MTPLLPLQPAHSWDNLSTKGLVIRSCRNKNILVLVLDYTFGGEYTLRYHLSIFSGKDGQISVGGYQISPSLIIPVGLVQVVYAPL